jgi:hypothetical protein
MNASNDFRLIQRALYSLLVALAIPQTSEPARPGPPQFTHL